MYAPTIFRAPLLAAKGIANGFDGWLRSSWQCGHAFAFVETIPEQRGQVMMAMA
jgi:hypothetical protein